MNEPCFKKKGLKLLIRGPRFIFYANNQQPTQFSGAAYTGGYIGLDASGQGTEAVFSSLTVNSPAA